MYTSSKITEFFILITINPNLFPLPPLPHLTKLSYIYEIILLIKQPKGQKQYFGCCHKLIIIANYQGINEPSTHTPSPL